MNLFRPRLRHLVGIGLAAGLLATAASATEPIGDQFRVSNQQPDGDADFDALDPAVAHNPTANQYLTVWRGETATSGENEIFGRLVSTNGTLVGAPFRISDMGPDGSTDYTALDPAVVYNATEDEYLVSWWGDDDTGPLFDGEFEIFVQRLSSNGTQIGTDTRVSNMGPDADTNYAAVRPAVAYNPTANEYLVSWEGDDDTAPLVEGEVEIFVQRLSADAAEIGGDTRVSDMGPDGETNYSASASAVAYNSTANEYLVSWEGDDNTAPLVDGEVEIFIQRLSGTAAEIGGDTRISDMGPDGDANYSASGSAVAYNSTANEYLLSWDGDDDTAPLVDNEREIFVQRLSGTAAEIGIDTRISDMGPDGDTNYIADRPAVAYNPTANEYLVSWDGDDNTAPLVDQEFEIYVQHLSADVTPIESDVRVSRMGPDGNGAYSAFNPAIAYNATANEYLVSWHGDDNTAPLVDNETEIYARRIKGGEAPPDGTPPGGGVPGTDGPPAAPNCVSIPAPAPGSTTPGTLKLTPAQLKINQRIGQAAIRRATAIQNWLDAGLVNADLCGGGLVPAQLHSGVAYTMGLLGPVPAKASPRTLSIPAATPKPGTVFELSAEQLQINQKVYSAAVRRANALKERIEGKLTGGDITNAQLSADRLRQDLTLGVLTAAPTPTPASTTDVPAPTPSTATFTPTIKQLRINQKIAQAAVKRTNELRAALASGLKGENFADGSVTAVDFAP